MSEQLLTVAEAAKWLRVSEKTVRRLIWSGSVPYVQLGGAGRAIRLDPDEVIEACRTGGRTVACESGQHESEG
jgi:excisionase family DNA binding protein